MSDASLVTSLGVTLALQQYRYEDAVHLGESFFRHPAIDQADPIDIEHHSTVLGCSLILSGNVSEGTSQLDGLLANPITNLQYTRHGIRNQLLCVLEDLGLAAEPHAELTNLIVQLLTEWKGQQLNRKTVIGAKTNQDLLTALLSTYRCE